MAEILTETRIVIVEVSLEGIAVVLCLIYKTNDVMMDDYINTVTYIKNVFKV